MKIKSLIAATMLFVITVCPISAEAEQKQLFWTYTHASCHTLSLDGQPVYQSQKDDTKKCAQDVREFLGTASTNLCIRGRGVIEAMYFSEWERTLNLRDTLYEFTKSEFLSCKVNLNPNPLIYNSCGNTGGFMTPEARDSWVISNGPTSGQSSTTGGNLYNVITGNKAARDIETYLAGICSDIQQSPNVRIDRTLTILNSEDIDRPEYNPESATPQPSSVGHVAYLCCTRTLYNPGGYFDLF